MQQYFINEILDENKLYSLSSDDSFHVTKVMRKVLGDRLYVVFNNSEKYVCEIVEINKNEVVLKPFEKVSHSNELCANITIAIPPLKNDKLEYLLQKATELGVGEIAIFNSDRNIAKLKNDKVNSKLLRWEKILKESSEQSKRNRIPKILYFENINNLINNYIDYEYKLVAYEEESQNRSNFNFNNFLQSELLDKNIISIFGSEGGLSKAEVNLFQNNDYKLIGLGKRILRAETAPLYFLSCTSFFIELYKEK